MKTIHRNTVTLIIIAGSLIIATGGCKTPSILATEQQRLGDEFSNNHDHEQAIMHYRSSLEASRKLGVYRNMESEAEICRKISYAYAVQGNFEEAFNYAYYAYRRDSAISNPGGIITDLRDMGKARLYAGDFKNGMRYLDSVIMRSEKLESSTKSTHQRSLAETYLVLSRVESVLGRYNEGLDHARGALEIYSRLADHTGESESRLQIAKIINETGNPAQAEVYLNVSVELAEKKGLNTSRQLMVLADIAEDRAKYEDAIRLRIRSIEESKRAGIMPQVIWSTIRTGDTYAVLGDLESAERYYNDAVLLKDSLSVTSGAMQAAADSRFGDVRDAASYYREIGADISEALVYLRKGDIFMKQKNLPFASNMYIKAAETFEKAGSGEGIARSNLMLADIWLQLGQLVRVDASLMKVEQNTIQPENLWRLHFIKGKLLEKREMVHAAVRSYDQAIEIIEEIRGDMTIDELKSIYINDKIEVYDRLINLLISLEKYREAFNISEKARARAFLDMIGNKRIDFRSSNPQLVKEEQELRSEIQAITKSLYREDLGTGRGMTRSAIQGELVRTRDQYKALVRRIKMESGAFASMISFEPPQISDFQELASQKTAFVTYWTGPTGSFAWIISSDTVIMRKLLAGEDQVIMLTEQCREATQKVSDFDADHWRSTSNLSIQTLRDAYVELIGPIEEDIVDFTSIGIIPHKSLHLMPFQALIDADNTFFIEKKEIFYAPSLSTLVFMKNRKRDVLPGMLAMALGDREFIGFNGLPGTRTEVENISKIHADTKTMYEENSTETWFKGNAGAFGRIHLATHGYMDPVQPLFSFVLFAPTDHDDGMLTVNEVFELTLNAELVTLSACQTGLGSLNAGDEMVGLSRAMLYAGTGNVMVSLWSIADKQTSILMTEFYTYLQTMDPVQAIASAQRKMIRNFPAPFYWAPFMLIGSGISPAGPS